MILVIIFAIFLRVFILEVYVVPTSSMENTIIPGDEILVNTSLLETPQDIPWLNLIYFLIQKRTGYCGKTKDLKGSVSSYNEYYCI
jgi:signal peptidase I